MTFDASQLRVALSEASRTTSVATQLERLELWLQIVADDAVLFEHAAHTAQAPQVILKAPLSVWQEACSLQPKPGYQSLGALYRLCSEFSIQAQTIELMQSLPTAELLLEAARHQLHHVVEPLINTDDLSQIKGEYLKTPQGWVYVESAGNPSNPTICMLHTAGADSRQWHGLMSMPAMLEKWHMVAFDMPGHGRSALPDQTANWQWKLTQNDYRQTVSDFIRQRFSQPVVLMGCSMGSAIGVTLLAKHPELFRAAILLETPYHSPGRRTPYLDHPKVHGARLAATWVASLLSPHSPLWRRKLATWIYSQGAPSVYDGDLAFYSDEFRANEHTANIDTAVTPLWLLTGDYDYSASPTETKRVAAEIKGSVFKEMQGFGHFPMTEDPERLHQYYLKSIFSEINTL
jgi:pimeloyl-ACP methyl ester carboxylesterase